MSQISRWIKDPFPGLSHFFGAMLSIAAMIVLLQASHGRPIWVIAFSIYGASLILLYLASGCCHSIHCRPGVEKWLDRFDYMAIFLLIAGTYTPLCLIALHGAWGWTLLGLEWGLAVLGIGLVLSGYQVSNAVRSLLYAMMAWLALIAVIPISRSLSSTAIWLLLAGGAFYSVGAIVFVRDRPHLVPGWFNAHDLWHCMVLTGSACHFGVMLCMIASAS